MVRLEMELDNKKPLPEYGWEWDIYVKLQDFFYEYHKGKYVRCYKEKYSKHYMDYNCLLVLFKNPEWKRYFLPKNADYFTEQSLIKAFKWVYVRIFTPNGELVSSVLANEMKEKTRLQDKKGDNPFATLASQAVENFLNFSDNMGN